MAQRAHPKDKLAASEWSSPDFSDDTVNFLCEHPEYTQIYRIYEWYEQGKLSAERLNELLAIWWTQGGYPSEIGFDKAVEMLRYAGLVKETRDSQVPTGSIVVHRGAPVGEPIGLCWSLDRDVAAWFARRSHDDGSESAVFTTTVEPSQILGIFDGSTENEIAIDPSTLDTAAIQTVSANIPGIQILALERLIKRCPKDFGDDIEGADQQVAIYRRKIERIRAIP